MEPTRESQSDICHECSTKDGDSAQKRVYHCELCEKWFCERHLKPKFPFFVDWDTVFDVQGNPEIKLLFYTEYQCEGGHPDFVYWRKTFEALDMEEKTRTELISIGLSKMNKIFGERERKRRIAESKTKLTKPTDSTKGYCNPSQVKTTENLYHHDFMVPIEVYSDPAYREELNRARTLEEAELIIDSYRRQHNKLQKDETETKKQRKHWWNKS